MAANRHKSSSSPWPNSDSDRMYGSVNLNQAAQWHQMNEGVFKIKYANSTLQKKGKSGYFYKCSYQMDVKQCLWEREGLGHRKQTKNCEGSWPTVQLLPRNYALLCSTRGEILQLLFRLCFCLHFNVAELDKPRRGSFLANHICATGNHH